MTAGRQRAHRERTLIRIDASADQIAATIATDADGRVAAGEGAVWVAGAGQPVVDRVDPESNDVTHIPTVAAGCDGLHDITVADGAVWVTSQGGVCRINPVTNAAGALWLAAPGPPVVMRTEPVP